MAKDLLKAKVIGIIGCGNMGKAIATALCLKGLRRLVGFDTDFHKREYLRKKLGIKIAASNVDLAGNSDIIIVAVKPQDIYPVLKDIREALDLRYQVPGPRPLIISIAAGVTTRYIQKVIGPQAAIIRVMPNSPALINKGMSVICAGSKLRSQEIDLAISIFSCMGQIQKMPERLMDAVTAVSGSGPAYFFFFLESLIEAAVKLGISKQQAQRLVMQTARGSLELALQANMSLDSLIKAVASRGGTTEAALKVFKRRKLSDIVKKAIDQAASRSRELSR
jgi:pyrroline-5-carboxylate reductase